ncbi:regulator of G-protein signaling 21 isoform X2 [Triplophysa dalaica]|uniref:regulator of G-protein signaling 21 isoform X2 n=1 Tax=Triplophysa dalaica TaxID=1582913 RepID=UPI0024E00DCD|nr:regulator of G-protein signaling 21 isoform X2 [Triplophysa dalaica]
MTRRPSMPKLLFSRIRIYEFKDLIRDNKQPKVLDVLLSKNKQKNNIRLQEHLTLGLKLSDLLKNQDYLAAFRSFLETEYSAENVDFWLACREYSEISPVRRLYRAAEIYEEFLHPMAQKEVNVDHHIREKIKRSLAKPDLTCFDEAASHIYRLMEEDSCPRFHKSEVYQNLRNTDRNPK